MPLENIRIKLTVNKTDKGDEVPNFTISLAGSYKKNSFTEVSYEIMSKLKQDDDVIMEINSSLFGIPHSERQKYAMSFLDQVKQLGLIYISRSIEGYQSQAVLASLANFFIRSKPGNDTEILVYIPSDFWKQDVFKEIFPHYCTKFYIVKKCNDAFNMLDEMLYKMTPRQKLEMSRLVVTNSAMFASMGIFTDNMSAEDIKKLLDM